MKASHIGTWLETLANEIRSVVISCLNQSVSIYLKETDVSHKGTKFVISHCKEKRVVFANLVSLVVLVYLVIREVPRVHPYHPVHLVLCKVKLQLTYNSFE